MKTRRKKTFSPRYNLNRRQLQSTRGKESCRRIDELSNAFRSTRSGGRKKRGPDSTIPEGSHNARRKSKTSTVQKSIERDRGTCLNENV